MRHNYLNSENCFTFDNSMLLRTTILVMVLLVSFTSFSQKKSIANALRALQADDLGTAKNLIDSASFHPTTKDLATTWYYRGFVYKKIYGQEQKQDKESPARLEAIKSFQRFFELDTLGELHETAFKSTKYLASTLYNDAVTSLNEGAFDAAKQNFGRYEKLKKEIDPNTDFKPTKIQFFLVLGQQYLRTYEEDKEGKQEFFKKTQEAFQLVLDLDSNNISANYNMGILFYNEGVNTIKAMDYDLDFISVELLQDELVELFTQSLPYMKRAYELDPKKKEVLIGLSGIYFSLHELDKSDELQKQLEELEKSETEEGGE